MVDPAQNGPVRLLEEPRDDHGAGVAGNRPKGRGGRPRDALRDGRLSDQRRRDRNFHSDAYDSVQKARVSLVRVLIRWGYLFLM